MEFEPEKFNYIKCFNLIIIYFKLYSKIVFNFFLYLVKYNVWFSIYLDSSIGMILCQWLDLELDQGKVQRQKKYILVGFTCVFYTTFLE